MGATQLNEQELRNCIYQGVYTDLLATSCRERTLARRVSIQATAPPHERSRAHPPIFRHAAHKPRGDDVWYAQSLCNEEIRENKDMTPQEADEMREVFQETIRLVWEVFGDCAFRRREEEPPRGGAVRVGSLGHLLPGLFRKRRGERRVVGHGHARLRGTNGGGGSPSQRTNPRRVHQTRRGATFRRLLVPQPKAVVARADAWGTVMDNICGPKGAKRGAKAR